MTKFRQKALNKLRSPEELNEPLRVMPRQLGWTYTILLLLVVCAILWSVFGRLPATGRGQGILLTPNTVVPIQSPADGQLSVWKISVGDRVHQGQVIAEIHQPALVRELEQTKIKYQESTNNYHTIKKLRDSTTTFSHTLLKKKREILAARIQYKKRYIDEIKSVSTKIQNKKKELVGREKTNLESSLKLMKAISEQKKQRMESYLRLLKEELTSKKLMRSMSGRYDDSLLKLSEIALKIKNLDSKAIQLAQAAQNTQDLIITEENWLTQLILQQSELENEKTQLDKKYHEEEFADQNKITILKLAIERLEERLKKSSKIHSNHAGRILELTVAEGNVITTGQRIAQLETRTESLPVFVAGTVGALAAGTGHGPLLASSLIYPGRRQKLIVLAYFQDSVGQQISIGDRVRVIPTTVDRARFGSMRGRVTKISAYPVSDEAIANQIGSAEVARQLTANGHQIEVQIELTRDLATPSGYKWTSHPGPATKVRAGTAAEVWVTYERRSPLSFVFPFVRRWTGL